MTSLIITSENNTSSALWDKKELLIKKDIYPKKISLSFAEMAQRLQELKINLTLNASSTDNNIAVLKSFGVPVTKIAVKRADGKYYEEIKPQEGFSISYIENKETDSIEYNISKVE